MRPLFSATLLTLVLAGLRGCTEEPERPGLWIADLPICADKVRMSRVMPDRQSPDRSMVLIRLKGAPARELEAMSRAYVDQTLSITLDDKVVSAPTLTAPLSEGRVYISPPKSEDVLAIELALEKPC